MATIDEIIRQSVNPFDPVTFKTGNFWQEEDLSTTATVNSIHLEAIEQVTQLLNLVAQDHQTRTVLLTGDVGSGKSYVLKRLKETLNSQAFFVYIPPFVDREHIWRHTLRQTVDSLMYKPEGQKESQLLLWLQNLSAFKTNNLKKKLMGEKKVFVNNFKSAYPVGIYQPNQFFGALYHLNNSELYFNACSWLRGDDLEKDELESLKINKSIDSETAAQGILANLGKISTSTYPIVLCFDQIETKQLPNGSADIQPIFNVNTSFHNERLKNFLILISINIHTLKKSLERIQQSDKDRVERTVALKQISIDQAEALWASRLFQIHSQAVPEPDSNIYPLTRDALEKKFPGEKTTPRLALILGQKLFTNYKLGINENEPIELDLVAAFKLLWTKEFRLTEKKIVRIRHFSEPELISMLSRAVSAFQMQDIQLRLLPSRTYASYSFSYQKSQQNQRIGVIWAENPSRTFVHTMRSCALIEEDKFCEQLYLVRSEGSGRHTNQGYKLFKEVFIDSPRNHHIKPDLESIHYLATYDRLINSVLAQELVIGEKTISLKEIEGLVRDSGVFENCSLLQDLGIIPKTIVNVQPDSFDKEKDFLLSFIRTHYIVSRRVANQTVLGQFPKLTNSQVEKLIQNLCQEEKVRIIDETIEFDDHIICLIPQQNIN